MELNDFAKHAGTLLRHGLKRGGDFDARTEEAYKAIYEDTENAFLAFRNMLDELGLVAVRTASRKNLAILPSDANSIFALKFSELKRQIGKSNDSNLKSELLGFFMLSTVSTFYPSRESISYATVNKVVDRDVYDMVKRLVDFGMQDESDTRFHTLAHEVNRMPEQDDSHKSQFRSYYVTESLRILVDTKLATSSQENGETVYYATARLRDICNERVSAETLHMAEILNRFHERNDENSNV